MTLPAALYLILYNCCTLAELFLKDASRQAGVLSLSGHNIAAQLFLSMLRLFVSDPKKRAAAKWLPGRHRLAKILLMAGAHLIIRRMISDAQITPTCETTMCDLFSNTSVLRQHKVLIQVKECQAGI